MQLELTTQIMRRIQPEHDVSIDQFYQLYTLRHEFLEIRILLMKTDVEQMDFTDMHHELGMHQVHNLLLLQFLKMIMVETSLILVVLRMSIDLNWSILPC